MPHVWQTNSVIRQMVPISARRIRGVLGLVDQQEDEDRLPMSVLIFARR
jgi:hypothetical protein